MVRTELVHVLMPPRLGHQHPKVLDLSLCVVGHTTSSVVADTPLSLSSQHHCATSSSTLKSSRQSITLSKEKLG